MCVILKGQMLVQIQRGNSNSHLCFQKPALMCPNTFAWEGRSRASQALVRSELLAFTGAQSNLLYPGT